jgi:hypothetical protein
VIATVPASYVEPLPAAPPVSAEPDGLAEKDADEKSVVSVVHEVADKE